MADPTVPTRNQIAALAQNDPAMIKALERLFIVAGDLTPADIATLTQLIIDNSYATGAADNKADVALSEAGIAKALADLVARAPSPASQEQINNLEQQISALQQTPPPKEYRTPRYGSFYDTTTQTAAAINTAYAMTFNTTDLSNGVYLGTPTSRVYVDRPNVYNIQFSAQVDKTAGGVALMWIWLRKNGVNVPDSSGQIRIQGNNAEVIAAWNYIIQLNAGDYIELMWEVDDTSVILLAEVASAIHPSVPSIILTVTDNVSTLEV
jgi:hypothetical protein